ncbi:MAG: hypothetical protein ACLGGX_08100 [Bdellovibrionia bacterium]
MAKIIALIVVFFAQPLFAQTRLNTLLGDIESFYDRLHLVDLIEMHYWLDFKVGIPAEDLQKTSGECATSDKFNVAAAQDVVFNLQRHTTVAIELGYYGSAEQEEMFFKQNELLEKLTQILDRKRLALCVDYTTPEYSDGHEKYFVMVNGKLRFVFEVGYPD